MQNWNTILKITAQENMEEWEHSPIVEMETVKAAYNFLSLHGSARVTGEKTYKIVADFLAWPPRRVQHAISNLRAAGQIKLEGKGESKEVVPIPVEVFQVLPCQRHTEAFRSAVRTTKASPEVQKAVVEEVAKGSADKKEAIRLRKDSQIEKKNFSGANL